MSAEPQNTTKTSHMKREQDFESFLKSIKRDWARKSPLLPALHEAPQNLCQALHVFSSLQDQGHLKCTGIKRAIRKNIFSF